MLSERAMAVMRHFQGLKTILSVTREEGGLVVLTNKLSNTSSSPQIIKLFPSGSFRLLILLSGPHVLTLINHYKRLNTLIKILFLFQFLFLESRRAYLGFLMADASGDNYRQNW